MSACRRVLVLGATGTIGQASVRALLRRGHEAVCLVRPRAGMGGKLAPDDAERLLPGATVRVGDATDPTSLARDGFCGEHFDVLVSCLASRTGAPHDAWAIDHRAHVQALDVAKHAGVPQVVVLSAICVQKPPLAFQQAKLAFEKTLVESGVTYWIVRPTAFFKSLSGQVERVKQVKPFLVFGDGTLTTCKPISDADLGDYLAGCLDDPSRHNCVLPIGGPGEPITPRQQGERLFALLAVTGRASSRCPWPCLTPSLPCSARSATSCRHWPREPSSRGSVATTRPNRCWCSTLSQAATTLRPRLPRAPTHCSTSTKSWSAARSRPSAATTPCSERTCRCSQPGPAGRLTTARNARHHHGQADRLLTTGPTPLPCHGQRRRAQGPPGGLRSAPPAGVARLARPARQTAPVEAALRSAVHADLRPCWIRSWPWLDPANFDPTAWGRSLEVGVEGHAEGS